MSGGDPTGLVDKVIRGCFSILLAAIALYFAVGLVESIWPTLLIVGGIAGGVWVGLVVYKTMREKW